MAKKKDPSITYLNNLGFNVVKLPRAGIEPMDVVGRDETNQWLGPLRAVWQSSIAEPTLEPPRPAVEVAGKRTDSLNLGVGLKVLSNALAAFGATVPSLDFAYKRARSVQFSYTDVTLTSVSPFAAGDYLSEGTLHTQSPVVAHYFQDPESQAFLITSVLKSTSITVSASDEHGVGVTVDVPAIQELLGANVSVSTAATGTNDLTFKGITPITFGFSVNEIEYDGTRWSIHGVEPSGENAFGIESGTQRAIPEPPKVLLGSACLLRI
jgi:hypothetical protein